MSRFIACTIGLVVALSMGGCPQPGAESGRDIPSGPVTEISPSEIPAGTYSGQVTATLTFRINGDMVDQNTMTSTDTVSFSANGIPLDFKSGEPERPGLSATFDLGDTSVTQVTETVVSAGKRVTVTYQSTYTYTNIPDFGTLTLHGIDQTVYTLRSDGAIEVTTTSSTTSDMIEGIGVYTVGIESFGVLTLGGSGGSASGDGGDSAQSSPGASELVCPFVLDEDPLFTLTIPCGTIRAEPSSEVPTADYEMYFFDDDRGQTYIVVTVAPESLPTYSAPGTAQTGVSFRYDGMMQTSSGDLLVLATAHLQTGDWVNYAYGLLADGRMLMVGTGDSNPLTSSFMGSISLADTDGRNIGTAPVEGIPALLAPAPDGLVLLDNNTAYRVTGSSELQRLASWEPGATILVHDASLISYFCPFFLTNRSEWVSVEADYVGVSSQSTIESVTDLEYGSVEIALADGSDWRVAYTDEGEAKSWQAGDEVAVIEDSGSFLGHTMMRLSTGQTLVVEPN